jgi:hypothetical protein
MSPAAIVVITVIGILFLLEEELEDWELNGRERGPYVHCALAT